LAAILNMAEQRLVECLMTELLTDSPIHLLTYLMTGWLTG